MKLNLKILIPAVLVASVLTSCNQREKELEEKLSQLESLSAKKDHDIDAFITTLTNIQTNLDSIKELEGIITKRALNNSENHPSTEDAIVDDMILIYRNMKQTQDRIEELEKTLQESSIASEKLRKLVAQLKADIARKDAEISALKDGLAKANIYIDELMADVDRLALENERRVQVIQQRNIELQQKEAELHTGFWVAGSAKELREKKIIEREGAFLGIGGVKVVSEDMDLTDLEQINIQQVTELALGVKRAELVTSHPKHSYEFVKAADKTIAKLVIDDPDEFWQNSKVLVVVTN